MKVKHLLLGVALVAIMAACGKKAETTPTETTESPMTEQVESPVVETAEAEAPQTEQCNKTTAQKSNTTTKANAPAAAKQEASKAPAVDPCDAKVKAFERFADELAAAKEQKTTVKGAKAYAALSKQASAQKAEVRECGSNPDFKTRVNNAMAKVQRTMN